MNANITHYYTSDELYAKIQNVELMSSERLNRELVKAYVDHRIAQIEKTLGDKIDKLSQNVEKLIEMIQFNPGDGPEFLAAEQRFNENIKNK